MAFCVDGTARSVGKEIKKSAPAAGSSIEVQIMYEALSTNDIIRGGRRRAHCFELNNDDFFSGPSGACGKL